MLVKIFNPIWKLKFVPIKFIKYIVNPPNIELKIIFNIFFNGTIKILPIKKIKHIQAKYVIIFSFIDFPPKQNLFIITIFMLVSGQLLLNIFSILLAHLHLKVLILCHLPYLQLTL